MSTDTRPYRLLFVCTGNICRSPMAHGIAEWFADQTGHRVEVQSASTLGLDGRPADPNSVAVCAELGIDIGHLRATPLEQELVDWADYILVMELAHAQHIRAHHAEVGDKVLMLGNFGGLHEIDDPIGGWRYQFRKTRDEIKTCVETFMMRLPPERRE